MSEKMSTKERWLAAIHMKPVDRLPFWPKLSASYIPFRKAPFNRMTVNEIHDFIGSDKHCWLPDIVQEVHLNSSFEEKLSGDKKLQVFTSRLGNLERIFSFDAPSQSWHPVKLPVKNVEDVKILTEFYNNCSFELDGEALQKAVAQSDAMGENVVTAMNMGESPLMYFVEFLAGVENAHYLLIDYQEEVEELFDAMHRVLLRKVEIYAEESPADLLYFVENTSTTLISPAQYEEYCFKHICDYGGIINQNNRRLVLHMCGHLKDLLPILDKVPALAFEAFTSPTVGNTRLIDGRSVCGNKCLIGGTNAVTWTKTANEIIEEIQRNLDVLPHHRGIVMTSAGVMPPMCEPETIKLVVEWLKTYEIRM